MFEPDNVPLGVQVHGSNLTPIRSGFANEFGKNTPHLYVECQCSCGRETYVGRWTDVKRLVSKHCGRCTTDAREATKARRRSEILAAQRSAPPRPRLPELEVYEL